MKYPGFVERAFKLKFGLKLSVLSTLGLVILTAFLYSVTSKTLDGSYGRAVYAIYDLKIRIFPLIFASSYSILILAAVTISIAVISVFFSHKIAGPIFRLERNLELIGSGDLTVHTKFRENDQLMLIADELNGMVRSLNHNVRNCSEALSGVKSCEERLERLLAEENPSEKDLKEALEALKRAVEDVKKTAFSIKTGITR